MSQAHFRFPDLAQLLTLRQPLHCKEMLFPNFLFFLQKGAQTNTSGFGTITGKLEGLHSP